MNWIDIIIVIATLVVAFICFRQGIISMFFTLAGLIGGVFIASRYHTFLGDGGFAQVIAFVIVLVCVLVAANAISFGIKRMVYVAHFGWADRVGAGVLGVVIGLLICSCVLAMAAKTTTFGVGDVPAGEEEVHEAVVTSQDWASCNIGESCIAEVLLGRTSLVRSLLPGDFDFLEYYF